MPTALACVDYLLGGPGGEQPIRQLTDLETGLLRNLIEQMLSVLRYALEPTLGAEPVLRTVEFNPQFVQAVSATDGVIVGSFQMRVGNQECVSTLCIPFSSLLPRLQVSSDRRPQTAADRLAAERNGQQLRAALGGVPVDVVLAFQPIKLTPEQIVRLEPGDVVQPQAPGHHATGRRIRWHHLRPRAGRPAGQPTGRTGRRQRQGEHQVTATMSASELARAAAEAALANLPISDPLQVGEPTADLAQLQFDGVAVTARFSGGRSGEVLIAVERALADALQNSPLGALDVAAALAPALAAAANVTGTALTGPGTALAPAAAAGGAAGQARRVRDPAAAPG